MLHVGLGSDRKGASLCPWEIHGLVRKANLCVDQPSGQAVIEDKEVEKGIGEGATEKVTFELGL